jgi:hypothetical protein
VQGADLSVRDGALWLRTLGRLERIDAVLRRVDDCFCDPLELREDSILGAPGMVQAVRAGNLTVANALGSGVLEHPGLMAFLPALCEQLLGEELLLPHLRTWWCGRPGRTAPSSPPTWTPWSSSPPPARRCSSPGHGCCSAANSTPTPAHGCWPPSTPSRTASSPRKRSSPPPRRCTWTGASSRGPSCCAASLVAEEDGYAVMPGGLGRVALAQDTPMVSTQLGGIGKDTWVLATEPEREETLLGMHDSQSPAVVRESDVSSRVADNLFWIGRYAERAEGLVRLLRVTAINFTERSSFAAEDEDIGCLASLVEALNEQCQAGVPLPEGGAPAALAAPTPELLSLITDLERVGSLPQTLQALGPGGLVGARAAVQRHLARHQRHRGHLRRLTGAAAAHPELGALRAGPAGDLAGGLLGADPGEHDPQRGLALPGGRPAAGARHEPGHAAALDPARRRAGARGPGGGGRARRHRQPDHLPPPLPGRHPGRRAAGPGGAGRGQSALAGLPDRASWRGWWTTCRRTRSAPPAPQRRRACCGC